MKIVFIIIFAFGCSGIAFSQYNFTINGTIDNTCFPSGRKNLKDGDKIFLNFINLKRKDSAVIYNNKFRLTGQIPYPSVAMLEQEHGGDLFLLDNSSYDFSLTLVKTDSIHLQYNSVIKTQSFFFNAWKNFSLAKAKLYAYKTTLTDLMENAKNQDSILFYKSEIKMVDKTIANNYKHLAVDYPNSYIAAYIIVAAPDFSYKDYYPIYQSFPDSIKNSFYGNTFLTRLNAIKNLQINEGNGIVQNRNNGSSVMTDINGIDTSYRSVVINDQFLQSNKYTLIEFWASWCGPCRIQNENLRLIKSDFKKKGGEIIGFSLDSDPIAWKKAVAEDKTGWLQISDLKAAKSPIVEQLKIEAIPFNILLDSTWKIIARNVDKEQMDVLLQSGS